jgi:diguanylate cyclase (GGDEF)-like protein
MSAKLNLYCPISPQDLTFEFAMEQADRLTAKPDYLSLTEELIAQLHIVPTLHCARVFEVHTVSNGANFSDVSTDELIVREVSSNLEELQPFNDIASIKQSFQRMGEGGGEPASELTFQQVILPIPGENGQMRVLLVEADCISSDYWTAILLLLNIYKNLSLIFDEKERDKLTGLYNRQTFDEKLARVLRYYQKRAVASGRDQDDKSWLAILDIDYFKKVNDNFGHLIGDEVLLLFSRIMEQSFRQTDTLFRYGGEEFVVILNATNSDGARIALERFRKGIASYDFPQVGHVTVSIGYVRVEEHFLPTSLFECADKALYSAKESGRDRVVRIELPVKDQPGKGDIELF